MLKTPFEVGPASKESENSQVATTAKSEDKMVKSSNTSKYAPNTVQGKDESKKSKMKKTKLQNEE